MSSPSTFIKALLVLLSTTHPALADEPWAGRKLAVILGELQAQGLPLLYSTQVVNDELVIAHEPPAGLQLQRLRSALQALGLMLKNLEPDSAGYAVVRAPVSSKASDEPALEPLQEVMVYASRYQLTRDASTQPASLPQSLLENSAGTTQDVLRNVQLLPGAASNSLSALSHVRGGYEDENLYRFDGVELYKPVHLKDFQGLFGLLDPDWVQSLNFYSGAYPVQFGNHNAAVVDLEARQTTDNQYALGASLLYTSLFGSGSYQDQAGHWLLGYRRSNLPVVLRNTETHLGEPEFEDLLVRNSYQVANGELRAGALRLNDDLTLRTNVTGQQARVTNHDSYLWLGWQQPLSETASYRMQLTHTELVAQRQADTAHAQINNGELKERRDAHLLTLDASINLQTSEQQHWQAGLRANHTDTRAYYTTQVSYLSPLNSTFAKPGQLQSTDITDLENWDYAAYLDLQQQFEHWRTEFGLRYDVYPFLTHSNRVSPRLNLQYAFSTSSQLHFSMGRYVQAQALQTPEKIDAQTVQQRPESMQQTIIGLSQTLSPQLQLRIEAYDKRGSQLHGRSENILSIVTLASELEIDYTNIDSLRSRAHGIEFSLRSSTPEQHDWWLNYSWSRTEDQIKGRYVRRTWDQPHALTLGGSWSLKNWQLSGNTQWHTGWAYTPLLLNADQTQASLGMRNSLRYQDYLSMDLRAEYQVPLKSMQLDWSLELRNALNRSNDCCRDVTVSSGGSISVESESVMGIVPIVGLRLRF